MMEKHRSSASTILFRIILSAVFFFTAFDASHTLRYVLCGVLLGILGGEVLWARLHRRP